MQVKVYPLSEKYGGDFMEMCVKEAKSDLPDWYKNSSPYVGSPSNQKEKDESMTMKKCTPILDYLITGLNLHLPFAIYSNGKYPNREISSSSSDHECKIGNHHVGQRQHLPVSDDYDPYPLKIDFPFYVEPPKGYSCLFVPAVPYDNWPLFFPSALVQADKYKANVNYPFFVKKDFEGKIEMGTEFMKVFFIKREDFSLEYKEAKDGINKIEQHRALVSAFGSGFYKKLRLRNN
jgi:hypothetical protein